MKAVPFPPTGCRENKLVEFTSKEHGVELRLVELFAPEGPQGYAIYQRNTNEGVVTCLKVVSEASVVGKQKAYDAFTKFRKSYLES